MAGKYTLKSTGKKNASSYYGTSKNIYLVLDADKQECGKAEWNGRVWDLVFFGTEFTDYDLETLKDVREVINSKQDDAPRLIPVGKSISIMAKPKKSYSKRLKVIETQGHLINAMKTLSTMSGSQVSDCIAAIDRIISQTESI